MKGMRNAACVVMLLGSWAASIVHAQWLNYPSSGVPRLENGRVDLAARAPRTLDGHPDLSGVWHVEVTPIEEWRNKLGEADVARRQAAAIAGMGIGTNSIYTTNLMLDLAPGEQRQLLRPAAIARMREPAATVSESCLPLGYPRSTLLASVTKLIQSPTVLVMLIEEGNWYRQLYLDGRPLPNDPQPSWLGYSTGHWEGDTLVVDTNGLNDRVSLDGVGHPRSESMRMSERYRRLDFGHLAVQLTFDDPIYYTKPWGLTINYVLQADSDILEYVCAENEKDRAHLTR